MSRTLSLRPLLTLLALAGLALVFPALVQAQAADCSGLSETDLVKCAQSQQADGGDEPATDPDAAGGTDTGTDGSQQTGAGEEPAPEPDSGSDGTDEISQTQGGSGGGGTQQNDSQSDPDGEVDQSASTGGRTPPDVDCVADFDSREAAQEVLDADTNDPFLLDADGDGVACENLPREGVVIVRRVARVELARTGPQALWIGLAGGLCLAGGLTLRRGRTDS